MKNNAFSTAIRPVYLAGFAIILALPILTLQPWFFPPDWGKAVILRAIVAGLLGLLAYQWLYRPATLRPPSLKKNTVFWLITALFLAFLAATLFSVDMRFSLWGSPTRGGGFVNLCAYMAFAILAFVTLKKEDWQKFWLFEMGIGAIVALVAVFQVYGLFSSIFLPFPSSPPSTLGNSTFVAIYLLLLFFRTVFFITKEPFNLERNRQNALRLAYVGASLLFLWAILLTGSRAAYLGMLIGSIYFVLLYPKKFFILKITSGALLVAAVSVVYFVNTHPVPPPSVAHNVILQSVYPRLNLQLFLNDSRFYSWRIATEAFKEKPLLGWGPENFSVGFDKHYDPSLPYIGNLASNWWDRGHNIIFDTAIQAGALGLIAYLALVGGFFWKLYKLRSSTTVAPQTKLDAHALQTGLVAYCAANIFSFDSFATYLMFFMMLGYGMHLIHSHQPSTQQEAPVIDNKKAAFLRTYKTPVAIFLGIMLAFFIWQYNIWPFIINADANKAELLVADQQCDRAVNLMETVMKRRSILDARVRIQYVEMMNLCAAMHPQKNLAYAQRGIEVMKEAVAIQPTFSRLWIFLGGFTTVTANAEQDAAKKTALLTEAQSYLEKAAQLAPDHQELITEQIKLAMIAKDYQAMKNTAERCVQVYPSAGSCYFLRGLSNIYLGNLADADKDIALSTTKGHDIYSTLALNQLVTAYAETKHYQRLANAYQELIIRFPNVADYHASLAFTYKEMGEYQKARQEALFFLQMMPEAKEEVEAFLASLPR